MVEAVLAVEPVHHAMGNGLHDDHARVEVGLLVHVENDPVDKRAKEIAFAKLDDAFGHRTFGGGAAVQSFQFFHDWKTCHSSLSWGQS